MAFKQELIEVDKMKTQFWKQVKQYVPLVGHIRLRRLLGKQLRIIWSIIEQIDQFESVFTLHALCTFYTADSTFSSYLKLMVFLARNSQIFGLEVSVLDLGDTSLTIHRFDDDCNNRQNIENNHFDCWL